jgi:Predicted integral membrane protein (DUF2269)
MDALLILKWLHILSATVLFGTGLGTAAHLWMTHRHRQCFGDRSRSSEYGASGLVVHIDLRNRAARDWRRIDLA